MAESNQLNAHHASLSNSRSEGIRRHDVLLQSAAAKKNKMKVEVEVEAGRKARRRAVRGFWQYQH